MNVQNLENLVLFQQQARQAEVNVAAVKELKTNRLLREVSEKEIASFLDIGRWVKFKEAEIVSRQGEPVVDVLFIVGGRARAEVAGNGDSTFKAVVSFPGIGDDIGLLSLVDGAPHSATVTALEELMALSIPISSLRMRLQVRQDWYKPLAEIAVERMRTSGLWLQALM